jgi:hypothetical protein
MPAQRQRKASHNPIAILALARNLTLATCLVEIGPLEVAAEVVQGDQANRISDFIALIDSTHRLGYPNGRTGFAVEDSEQGATEGKQEPEDNDGNR